MHITFEIYDNKIEMEVFDPFDSKYEMTFLEFFHFFGKTFMFNNFLCYRTFSDQINEVISNVYVFNANSVDIKKLKFLKNGDNFDLSKKEDLERFKNVTELLKNFFIKNIKKNSTNLDNNIDFFT